MDALFPPQAMEKLELNWSALHFDQAMPMERYQARWHTASLQK
jgi:hypothetical protein